MPHPPSFDKIVTKAAPHVAYFTPRQPAPAGAFRGAKAPKLFTPLRIRNLNLVNRIGVSPMCLYSAGHDGAPTDYHLIHYGQYALRGPSLVIMESVAVSAAGRITPHCLGIYSDVQKAQLKRIVDFYHSQGKAIGPQLSHAGMRSSCLPLFYDECDYPVDDSRGGWLEEVVGPSISKEFPHSRALSARELALIVSAFKEAVRAAIVDCGFDFVEIHAAHGFLIHQFMSPLGNKRTDQYGGSFDNRVRLLMEILDAACAVRKETGRDFAIFVRISASDNDESNERTWRLADSVKLAPLLAARGVDLIDVSSGGMQAAREPHISQRDMAHSVKSAVKDSCLVSAVGGIRDGKTAEDLLQNGYCDFCLAARGFLKEPGMVERWADELGADVQMNLQDGWCFGKVWE